MAEAAAGAREIERRDAIADFLARHGWGGTEPMVLAGDASFRRYYRLSDGLRRAVLMDAPPDREDVRPFLVIARHLRRLGYSAPAVLAEDAARGLLLLEDLGDETYTRRLAAGGDEVDLYRRAVDLLIDLHRRDGASGVAAPPYDDDRLLAEAALLTDWFLPAVAGRPTAAAARSEYLGCWRAVFPVARAVRDTLVLRDYHVDNLMWLDGRDGVAACGLLDFQDAVIGPASYDLVSLLEDARRDVPQALQRAMLGRYLAAFPAVDRDAFLASYATLGAQRNAKIIGIFTRLMARDGKPQYLAHIPRVWRLLEGDLAHPALAGVKAWFDRHVGPEQRVAPAARSAR
jgi:hypothetical protein